MADPSEKDGGGTNVVKFKPLSNARADAEHSAPTESKPIVTIDPSEYFMPSPGRGGESQQVTIRLDQHTMEILTQLRESKMFPWKNTSDVMRYCIVSKSREVAELLNNSNLKSSVRDYAVISSDASRRELAKKATVVFQRALGELQAMEQDDRVGAQEYAAWLLKELATMSPAVRSRFSTLIVRCNQLLAGVKL